MKIILILSLNLIFFMQSLSNCKQTTTNNYQESYINYFDKGYIQKLLGNLFHTDFDHIQKQTNKSNLLQYSKIINNNIDSPNVTYHLKVKLTKTLPPSSDCGYIAFALVQKFEIIQSDIPNYQGKYILLIEPCPEFLGRNFFNTTDIYNVDAMKTNGDKISYTFNNTYDNEKLPKYWCTKISKGN